MRPCVVGFIVIALALFVSLLMLMIAQQSLKLDVRKHRKQQQQNREGAHLANTNLTINNNTTSNNNNSESTEISPFTWFQKLKIYLAELIGFDLDHSDSEEEGAGEIFRPTKLGHLNYQRRYANSINSFVSVTVSPLFNGSQGVREILLTNKNFASENDKTTDNNSTSSNQNEKQTTGSSMESQVQYQNDRIILLANNNSNSSEIQDISEPFAIDLLSTYRMNREAIAKQQKENGLAVAANYDDDDHNNNDNNYGMPQNILKCYKSKFDRLIAQKMNENNLSRPIVTSDGRFDNPFPTWSKQSLIDIIKFVAWEADDSNVPKNTDELDKELPIMRPNFINYNNNSEDFRVTWIGHATLLIQVDGYNILTDPMFSDRASFTQFFGPKRIRRPACDIATLPPIDIVLISHNHYDHLDVNSIRELNDRFGRGCRWIVPLGIGEFLRSMSVQNYAELDWWQKDCFLVDNINQKMKEPIPRSKSPTTSNRSNSNSNNSPKEAQAKPVISPVTTTTMPKEMNNNNNKPQRFELDIYLTPSQHWSRRGVNDVNKSLWGSFVMVSSSGATFFFGGDTAYCSAFKEIGSIFGPFVGAAIPIGAYKPRWFLKTSHVDPNEAVQIHKDLKSMKSIAIHHSTFILSNEHYKEPPRLLKEIMDKQRAVNGQVKEKPFVTLKHGETAQFCRTC